MVRARNEFAGRPRGRQRARVKIGSRLTWTIAVTVMVAAAWWWNHRRSVRPVDAGPADPLSAGRTGGVPSPAGSVSSSASPRTSLSPREKAARLGQIKSDYDEIWAKLSAEFAAGRSNNPGGLNAFWRQLALLKREKRQDLAAVLDSAKLKDFEMRETASGQLVQRSLGGSAATEEQRWAVFRVQRGFEEKFALTFDLTAPSLLEREASRLATEENIRSVLGDVLFVEWLNAEGPEFGRINTFVAKHGLTTDAALNVWRTRNDLTIRRLELAVQSGLSPAEVKQAQAALTRGAGERIFAILGPGVTETARQEVLS